MLPSQTFKVLLIAENYFNDNKRVLLGCLFSTEMLQSGQCFIRGGLLE